LQASKAGDFGCSSRETNERIAACQGARCAWSGGRRRSAREALLWKLEGLSEYDIRRPLTPTGTNLLGLRGTPTFSASSLTAQRE
jgi:hypothetical protein